MHRFAPSRLPGWIALLAVLLIAALPGAAWAQSTGVLEVKANVDGALVLIDGEPLGETPLIEVIAAGRHRVAAWRTHRRRNHGAAGELALRWLEASDLRCVDGPRPRRWTWRERTCWRCPPARAAADSPGAAR